MKTKYVVDELGDYAIFPNHINHDLVGRLFNSNHRRIAGAGFIEIFDGVVNCYGESLSLGIKTRGSVDSEIIANKMNLKFDN